MYKDGSILKQGHFEEIAGIYYSNTFFNAPKPTPIYQGYNYYSQYKQRQKPKYRTEIDLEDLTDD